MKLTLYKTVYRSNKTPLNQKKKYMRSLQLTSHWLKTQFDVQSNFRVTTVRLYKVPCTAYQNTTLMFSSYYYEKNQRYQRLPYFVMTLKQLPFLSFCNSCLTMLNSFRIGFLWYVNMCKSANWSFQLKKPYKASKFKNTLFTPFNVRYL